MNWYKPFFIIISSFFIGFIFHAYQKEWIIINFPYQTTSFHEQKTIDSFAQKKIPVYFWKNNTWRHEYSTVIWSDDVANNSKTILNHLITVLEDEAILESDIQIIATTLSNQKELLVSFNKNIYSTEHATYDKMMIVHSFLKTLYENKISVQSVRFLIQHQTIIDDHLNFTVSWPITGYVS
jgi:hypothetical protein